MNFILVFIFSFFHFQVKKISFYQDIEMIIFKHKWLMSITLTQTLVYSFLGFLDIFAHQYFDNI